MKRIILTSFVLMCGAIVGRGAEPVLDLEKTPLPPGPILNQAPAFAEWQITYFYGNPARGNSPPPSTGSGKPPPDPNLPKLFTMTRTKPLWRAVFVNMGGQRSELLWDGEFRFTIGPKDTDVTYTAPGIGISGLDHYSSQGDFPDVGWVSVDNYLGVQKGTTFWVFQQGPDGPMAWIDFNTHFPVRWQSPTGEVRTYQFHDPPTELLVVPPYVAGISRDLHHMKQVEYSSPPHL